MTLIFTVYEIPSTEATLFNSLKRGVIRNETEYYLIAGVLSAMTSDAEKQVALGKLIAEFESKASKKKKA